MKRRSFLKAVFGGTVLAPVALKFLPKLPTAPTAPTVASTFGLAPIKAEGTRIAYDQVTGMSSAETLWPGVRAWWNDAYVSCPTEYKDLFEPGDST